MNSQVLFYRKESSRESLPSIPDAKPAVGSLYIWKPSRRSPFCPYLPLFPYSIWSLFHFLKYFRSSSFSVYLIIHNGQVLSRLIVFPKFFRFPFMQSFDLQVGDLFTNPRYRKLGLSSFLLSHVIYTFKDRPIWFLCLSSNSFRSPLIV